MNESKLDMHMHRYLVRENVRTGIPTGKMYCWYTFGMQARARQTEPETSIIAVLEGNKVDVSFRYVCTAPLVRSHCSAVCPSWMSAEGAVSTRLYVGRALFVSLSAHYAIGVSHLRKFPSFPAET